MNKQTISAAAAVLALLPSLARAHPGHSAFEFTAGPPHPGHESELGTLLIATALTVALVAGARWVSARRR